MFIKKKYLQIKSDGSLNISEKNFNKLKQFFVFEKDNKNFHFNTKNCFGVTTSKLSKNYKKKYLL